MLNKVVDAVRRVRKSLPPPKVKSLDEIIGLFKQEGVVLVNAETTFYKNFPFSGHRIVVDYIGFAGLKSVRRQEVLKVVRRKVNDDFLVREMIRLYPAVRERIEKLQSELGITVKII